MGNHTATDPQIVRYVCGNQTGAMSLDNIMEHTVEVYRADSEDSCVQSYFIGVITKFLDDPEPMLICMKGDGRATLYLRKVKNEYLFPPGYFYVDKTFEAENKKSRQEFFDKYSEEKNNK
ncbi:MAG: hypothetical protein WC916_02235 [Candidatus Woesearchaeota archaeon]